MNVIFIQLLNMSYQAGIVICFIILARFLLKIIKAPKKYAYYLWGIVFVRMICPFSIKTVFSLLPQKTQPISTTILYEQMPQIHTGRTVIDYATNRLLPVAQPVASVNPMQIWILIAQIIWLSGFALLLIYSVIAYVKLKYRFIGAVNYEDNIYLADHLETPFVLGIIRPRIYLPSNLNQNEMNYILQHERAHLKRCDHIVKLIAFLTASVHWFNPLSWVAFTLGCKDMEMSCDEYVLKASKEDIRKEYSACLLSLSVGSKRLSGTPLTFGEGDTKGRIKNIIHYKKPARIAVVLALIIVAVLAACLVSNPESSVKSNNRKLKKAMKNITEEQVAFNELVPFEWTCVYTFDPYLSVQYQEEIMGIQSDELQESVNENMVQLVFLNGDQVVSCICGYADNLGYSINLRGEGIDYLRLSINYRKITYEEDAIFSVKTSNDIVYLDYVKSRNQMENVAADDVTITCGLSSWAMFGAPQTIINELIETYLTMELSPISVEPEFEKQLNVTLSNGDNTVFDFGIDPLGRVVIADDTKMNYYMCQNGSSIYKRIYEVYQNSINGKEYDSGIFIGITDLDEAVSQAILLDNQVDSNRNDMVVEAHTTLKIETNDTSVTVFAMVLEQGFSYTESSITEEGGSHMPVALTFEVKEDGTYTLQEYWRPMDGSYYASSIADKFPSDIYEEALDTQKYIYGHIQACYKQVIEYGNINTDLIIENLISEICSSPTTASSVGDYIEEHEIEYLELRYLGEYTLDYCFGLFEEGRQEGLEGQIMAIACNEIMGNNSGINFETGQDWYDKMIRNESESGLKSQKTTDEPSLL